MLELTSARDAKDLSESVSRSGKTLGFVPTMGALHEGHSSLVRHSVKDNELTVVSIFVNPTQFRPGEDLDQYPRTPEADLKTLEELGVDAVFMPHVKEMYPEERAEVTFALPRLGNILCAASRPGHFEGVLQVVSRLLNIVRPNTAYFGKKDYQQLQVIRNLVKELFFDVKIVGCDIIREKDGLAMSSRNIYLNDEERKQAVALNETLKLMRGSWLKTNNVEECLSVGNRHLSSHSLIHKDYLELMTSDLNPFEGAQETSPVALVAAFLGKTRLIDNLLLESPEEA